MPTIQTVRGPVDTAQLGQVLMHEHVFVMTPEIMQQLPGGLGTSKTRSPTRSPGSTN